jgi:type II secretory pathway component PulK
MRGERSSERGAVLILAIFAVVFLSVLAVGISSAVRVELRAAHASLERMQGLFLAEAGIREARAILLYDDRNIDTLQEEWGREALQPLDLPREFGAGYYRVRIDDACGRINVNKADVDTLVRLTGDIEAAQAMVEWREPMLGQGDAYYETLPEPYAPRHAPFQTLGELLLVRGVTPDMFFGTPEKPGLADLCAVEGIAENTDANGSMRVGLNEFRNWGEFEEFQRSVLAKLGGWLTMYDATEIFNGWSLLTSSGLSGYTSLAQLATVAGLGYDRIINAIDHLTIDPGIQVSGLVNVNTARPEVIAALPGGSMALGTAIVARRTQTPFGTLGEFTEFLLNQPNGPDIFAQMIDHVNLKSSSFIAEAMGYPPTERGFRTLRAVLRRTPDDVYVIHQSEEDWPLPPPAEQAALAGGR